MRGIGRGVHTEDVKLLPGSGYSIICQVVDCKQAVR